MSFNRILLAAPAFRPGLPFHYRICSQFAIDWPDGLSAGRWAPWICGRLSADVYIDPVAGRELFDPADFADAGISLEFLDLASFIYDLPYNFEKDLSILDVLMWNSPDAIVQGIRRNSSLISILGQESGGEGSRVIQI